MAPEPTDKKSEETPAEAEVKERVENYVKHAERVFGTLESAELTEDRAVRIKLKGGEEIIYKSPKELFIPYAGEASRQLDRQYNREIENQKQCYAGRTPLAVKGELKFSDFNTPESLAILKKDFDMARIFATETPASSFLNKFAGITENNPILRDEIFQGIPDKDISENVRMFSLFDQIIHTTQGDTKEIFDYFVKIKKEDPKFMVDFMDFSVRECLTSGHSQCMNLLKLLIEQPELYEKLDKAHRDFSIPYLFERDCYSRFQQNKGKEELQAESKGYKEYFIGLGMDVNEIKQRLKDLGSNRKYCPGMFEE